MAIEVREKGGILLLVPDGDITWKNSPALMENARNHMRAELDTLLLDMRPVSRMDSVGLGMLMGLRASAARFNMRVCLLEPTRIVLDLLAMVRFEKVLDIVRGDEAREWLRKINE